MIEREALAALQDFAPDFLELLRFASDQSSFLTGVSVDINGGLLFS